jgi:hypothetical protein
MNSRRNAVKMMIPLRKTARTGTTTFPIRRGSQIGKASVVGERNRNPNRLDDDNDVRPKVD